MLVTTRPAFADGWQNIHNNLIQIENNNSARPAVGTGSVVTFDEAENGVTDANLAYAHSYNCTGCRTVAVAVQVIVVDGTPTNVQPQNAAVAVNDSCQSCQTFAYAHQYLIEMTTQHVEYSQDAVDQLGRISQQISQVAHSGEDFVTMSAQLDQLSLQYYNTVYQALQNNGGDPGGQKSEHRQVKEQG